MEKLQVWSLSLPVVFLMLRIGWKKTRCHMQSGCSHHPIKTSGGLKGSETLWSGVGLKGFNSGCSHASLGPELPRHNKACLWEWSPATMPSPSVKPQANLNPSPHKVPSFQYCAQATRKVIEKRVLYSLLFCYCD